MPTKDSDGQRIVPFATVVQQVGNGILAAQLAEELQELTNAVKQTGKKGTLLLTISIAPIKAGNVANLIVTGATTVKTPKSDADTPSSVFFTDAAGNLTRDDPTQQQLPLRGLPTRSETA